MDCQIIRKKLVTISSFNMLTGEQGKDKRQEWRIEKCGVPIFGKNANKRKVCDSCLRGWTHEHNFMIDTEENKRLIDEEKQLLNKNE